MGFVRSSLGVSANFIFPSVLYLLLNPGVSFRVLFLVYAWIGIVDVVCLVLIWIMTVLVLLCFGVVFIQHGCFLRDLDFRGTWLL